MNKKLSIQELTDKLDQLEHQKELLCIDQLPLYIKNKAGNHLLRISKSKHTFIKEHLLNNRYRKDKEKITIYSLSNYLSSYCNYIDISPTEWSKAIKLATVSKIK